MGLFTSICIRFFTQKEVGPKATTIQKCNQALQSRAWNTEPIQLPNILMFGFVMVGYLNGPLKYIVYIDRVPLKPHKNFK